jgi:hypothetical protein
MYGVVSDVCGKRIQSRLEEKRMKSRIFTRIWLFLLLVVLSWIGFIVGFFLTTFIILQFYSLDDLMIFCSVQLNINRIVMEGIWGKSPTVPDFTVPDFSPYSGALILLVSSLVRCKSPARHAVVQTIACFGFGIIIALKLFMPQGEGGATFFGIFIATTLLGAAIAWIEAKKNLSLRKLSAVILAMFVVLYALAATISLIDGRFHKAPSTSTTQGTIQNGAKIRLILSSTMVYASSCLAMIER